VPVVIRKIQRYIGGMMEFYLTLGALSGITSGLFGIGGGIIVVPALAALFSRATLIPSHYAMHMAIGTSLATMIFTSLSGCYAHYQRRAIRWDIVKHILPLLLVGTLAGVPMANILPSSFLKIIFAFFLIFLSVRLIFNRKVDQPQPLLRNTTQKGLSISIGALISILGAGGGSMMVPFFLRLGSKMHEALGTSLVCSVFTSLVATLCFALTNALPKNLPLWNTGFVYWPAFLGIIVSSVLFAPIGTAFSHKLSIKHLRRLFALFLLLIAITMLVFPSFK
jgi:uncharacterized protein